MNNKVRIVQENGIEMTIPSNKRERLNRTDTDFSQSDGEESRSSKVSPVHKLKFRRGDANTNEQKKTFSWPVYKKLLTYARKEWKLFSVGIVSLLVSSLVTSMLPFVIGVLLDKISQPREDGSSETTERSMQTSHMELLYLLIALCVSTYIRTISNSIVQERIAITLRTEVFASFITNDIHFFEKYKSGELNSRVGNDINQAKSAISNNVTFMLRSIITTIANIFILMFMSWKLTLMVLVLVPLYILATSFYSRKTKMLVRQYQDVQAESSAHLNQIFTGIHVVKAFSGEEREINKYYTIQSKGYSINCLKALYSGLYFTATSFLSNIGILMILWYGGNLVMSGKTDLTAGELTSFIMYSMTLSKQASNISSGYSNIINGTSAVEKVFSMLDYKPFINEKEQSTFPDYTLKGGIQFAEVNFQYPKGDVQILRNLCLSIQPGDYVAFVGQSGSGKSTVVKLIQRFYQIQAGNLTFDGINARQMNIHNIRSQIGFVSQQAILFSGSIEENIVYGVKDYSYDDMVEACEKSGCMQFISNQKLFPDGFKTTVGEKGNQLSGGQRQRVSIARALMRKPKILIFDQATSALDSNSESVVQKSIQNLISTSSRLMTIIVIAHRLSTIIKAHRIYVMKQGRVVEQGDHESLLAKDGYYSELFQKQIQRSSSTSMKQILSDQNQLSEK